MTVKKDTKRVEEYYDMAAKDYIRMYGDDYGAYPANMLRLDLVVKRLKENRAKDVLDAGCGTCGPLIRLSGEGFNVRGFDLSEKMVAAGKEELKKARLDPDLIFRANIEDDKSIPKGRHDAVIALGVFPHISDEVGALANIRKRLNSGGSVYISFRNDLFSLYTANDYSADFILNRLIDPASLGCDVLKEIARYYSDKFKAGGSAGKKPAGRTNNILYKFHNALTVEKDLFRPNGFNVVKIHFYHYHAMPPVFENRYPQLFRKLSLGMEDPGSWKGYFMASAFVVEAVRDD